MALTLTQAQTALDAWIAADIAVAKGQSYSMNGRSLTLANSKEIREQIQYWERRVSAFEQTISQNQQAALADFSDV
jgi:ABC-type transport system involved in cytochrome bd biosynthesis fused ATPase/permease subunit